MYVSKVHVQVLADFMKPPIRGQTRAVSREGRKREGAHHYPSLLRVPRSQGEKKEALLTSQLKLDVALRFLWEEHLSSSETEESEGTPNIFCFLLFPQQIFLMGIRLWQKEKLVGCLIFFIASKVG